MGSISSHGVTSVAADAGLTRERHGEDAILREGRRHVARSGGIVFGGKLFTYAARIVMALLLARVLGAEQYGLYSLAITTAVLFASFASLGLDTAVVRFVSAAVAKDDAAGVRGTIQVGIGLPGAIAAIAAVGVFAFSEQIATEVLDQPAVASLLDVTALLVLITVVNRQLVASLQGFKRIDLAVAAEQFAQPVLRLGLIVILVVVGLSAWDAALAATVAAGSATLLMAVFLERRLRAVARAPGRREFRRLIVFAMPVYFSNIVTTLGHNIQILLLGILGTLSAVGIFAIASQLNLVSALFHTSIVAATMPLFAEYQELGHRKASEGLYHLTSKWTFALNLPFFLVVVLFPSQLLGIFGPEFTDGAAALVILSFASLVNAATGTSGALLDMSGYTKVKLLNASVGVVVSVLMSLLLIPSLGLAGAALAVLGATASVNVLRLVEVRVLIHFSPYDRSFVAPLVAGAVSLVIAAGVVLLLQAWFVEFVVVAVAGTALVATYAVILIRFGLDREDREFLRRVADRLLRRRRAGRSELGDTGASSDG